MKIALAVLLLATSSLAAAKGQAIKLDGHFDDVSFKDGMVTFSFTGTILDTSHPDEREGFPVWDYPIPVTDLPVTSSAAICMDHKARKNYAFREDIDGAVACFERLEEVVAAVQISQLEFTGDDTKTLETKVLSFYDMAQIRRENLARANKEAQ